jgi:uncharacterized protein YceK
LRFARIPTVALALTCSGCMTLDTLNDRGYRGPYAYSGARADLRMISETFLNLAWPFTIFFLVDLPFSTVADTLLLPVMLPRERKRLAELEQRQRIDVEQPPLVEAEPGEQPEETAERLLSRCRELSRALEDELLDCYSIGARIALRLPAEPNGAARRLSGAQYKLELRDALEKLRYAGDSIDWIEPEFEREGDAVRVLATRTTATSPATHSQRLLVGPCSDGGWRILEEDGIEPAPPAPVR